jgi:hypothetical protein
MKHPKPLPERTQSLILCVLALIVVLGMVAIARWGEIAP